MRKNRWLSLLLVFALVLSLFPTAFAAEPEQAETGTRLFSSLPGARALPSLQDGQHQPGDQVRVIVLTEGRPTAENKTLVQRFLRTDSRLMREHAAVRQRMAQERIGYKVNFEYTALLNGMSLTVDYADLDEVAAIPGVTKVIPVREYRLPETEPASVSASEMINATVLGDALAADGSGMVIAVLDTGITAGHEAFGIYDGMLQTPAYEKAQMLEAIADLGHGVYCSQKIPFQYDYADGDNDASDDHSGHGSHVAGIAAGYCATEEGEITFRGSAPDAQILAMKVFPSDSENTSSDIYMAALEDAFKLGADVINMSIGSPNGFVDDEEAALNDRIYERLENAGVLCCISAGNETNMSYNAQNWAGPGYVTAGYADYGILDTPASYDGNIAVAAAENEIYPAYLLSVGGESFPYNDSNGTAFLDAFAGQDLEYVMVPNLGEASDYDDIDVTGKIAVISRGEITFEEKAAFAAAAGAVAAVIYNNQDGALVSMAIEDHLIPSVFVSQEAGAALAAQEEKTFHVDDESTIIENDNAWAMADFSSWGPTNDLQIKPTITGVGGNVNSVLSGTEDKYEVQSGTSMSAPNVSGGYASLLEAVCSDDPGLTRAEAAAIVRNRTLSSAYPLIAYADSYDDEDYFYVPYSPRQQGAGLIDLLAAYQTKLTIADPLAELGDDPEKAGVFNVTAELKNISDEERTYAVSLDVMTDYGTAENFGSADEPDYHLYNCMMPTLLEEGMDYTLDAPETVTLAPGETKTVTATITLTDETKSGYLDILFENGAFIDGYLYFDSLDDEDEWTAECQHVTFLAFYGDWTAGRILEAHDWREIMDLSPEEQEEYVDYVDWEIDTVPTEAYLVDSEFSPIVYAGDAVFGYPEDGTYSDKRIAVSYNYEEAYANTLLVVPTIIRNARHIIMIARNAETGEIYAVDDTPYCTKTYYDDEEGWSTYAWFIFDGTDIYSGEDPVLLDDDTEVILEFYANFPYGEDVLGGMTPEEIVENGAAYLEYTVPCVVDSTAPVIESYEYDPETGDITVTVSDNQYLSAIYAMDKEGNDIGETLLFADEEPGMSHTVTMNVGEQVVFYIAALDYATNEGYETVIAEHDHDWSEWEVIEEPTCEKEGSRAHVCSICDQEETESIPASGHDLTETPEVPATCTAGGVKAYWTCSVCKNMYSDAEGKNKIDKPETIPATGHKLQAVAEVPATCTADGVKAYWKCDTCGRLFSDARGRTEITKPEAIAKTGHKLQAVAEVPATCTADGVKAYWKCDACGSLFSDAQGRTEITGPEAIGKLGHDWDEGTVTKEPTLISEGEMTFTCKNDPGHTRTEVIAKLDKCDNEHCPSKDFTDVDRSEKSWSHEPIDWAVLKEITNGTSKTTFSPGKACTRAEAVTFLWRAAGCPVPFAQAGGGFTDVVPGSYYERAVAWAVQNGITKGTTPTTFSPNATCTRGQIVTFLWRMEGEPACDAADTFRDVPANAYYAGAVGWAVANGITNGVSTDKFAPDSDCTRAHIVTFLWRDLEK